LPDPTPTELDDTIRQNATGPARASVDGQSVDQHSLADQIAADRYLASKKASRKAGLGVKTTKLIPPGAA
jgi:hypothetical protein